MLTDLSVVVEPSSEHRPKSVRATKENEGKGKAVFNLVRDQFLIDMCIKYRALSNTMTAAAKKKGWKKVVDKFNARFGTCYIKGQFQDHIGMMKKIYNFIKEAKTLSGFTWDPLERKVIASDEVWDNYIECHPEKKKYRDKKFPNFESMAHLFEDVATTDGNADQSRDFEDSSDEALSSPEPHRQESLRGKRGTEEYSVSRRKRRHLVRDAMTSEIHDLNEITKQLFARERENPPTLFEKITKIIMSMFELSTEQKVEAVCLIKGEREAGIFNAMTPECRLVFLKRLGLEVDF